MTKTVKRTLIAGSVLALFALIGTLIVRHKLHEIDIALDLYPDSIGV